MVHPRLSEDLVPLLTSNGRYQADYRHNSERRSRSSITDSDSQSVDKLDLSYYDVDGIPVHRRLHELAPPSAPDWPRRYPRTASLRFFVFSAFAAALLLMMYVPAYKQASNRPGSVAGWSYNTSRDTRTYVLPDNVTLLNQPKHVCRQKSASPVPASSAQHQMHSTPGPPEEKEPEIFLLVIICSSMSHFERRAAIRETWGNQSSYEFLTKRFENITKKFANVNMTENLFNEMGYALDNISSIEKRTRRDVTNYEDLADEEFVPNDAEFDARRNESLIVNRDFDVKDGSFVVDGNGVKDDVVTIANDDDIVIAVDSGNERDSKTEALKEILSNDVVKYNFISNSDINSDIEADLDRILTNGVALNDEREKLKIVDSNYDNHKKMEALNEAVKKNKFAMNFDNNVELKDSAVGARNPSRRFDSNVQSRSGFFNRRKRETLNDALKENKYVNKNPNIEDIGSEDPRFDNGDKPGAYDTVSDGNDEDEDGNILGNFDGNDVEENTFEEYDYLTEETNIMRIPPRGIKIQDDDMKALDEAKNLMKLSLKGDKISLTYENKNKGNIITNDDMKQRSEQSTRELLNDDLNGKYLHGYSAREYDNARTKDTPKSSDDGHKSEDKQNGDSSTHNGEKHKFVKTKYLFLLGQSANDNETELQARIDDEASMYGDIIQEGFVDSYNNLTLKSVMLLKWVVAHCGENVHYVMKTDDDMFVNIPRLIEALQNKSREFVRSQKVAPSALLYNRKVKSEQLLMGDLICDARPISDIRSKWYSPTYMYSGKVYPRYLSGSGYVMSLGAAQQLYHSALNTPLFHLEDVFITGMCSHKAGIKPRDHPGFSYTMRKFNTCIYQYLITAHQVTPSQMRQMFQTLTSPGSVHHLEACEARKILASSSSGTSFLASAKNALFGKGSGFLGSPRSIITGLAGFGYADARKKKLKKTNNGCS